MDEYFEKEETKLNLLTANTNCDELLRDIKKEDTPKFWHKIRFIKKILQDIIYESYEKPNKPKQQSNSKAMDKEE